MASNIDPRGIFRKVVKIEQTSVATLIQYECGHIGSHNPIYDYSDETQMRCFECGKIARSQKHPFCSICGWRKGGVDSWDGERCKCGMSAPALDEWEEWRMTHA